MNDASQPKYAQAISGAESKFNEIAALDGNLVSFQREASFAMQIVSGSEFLQKASPVSLRNAVINVASVGLTLNPAMKLAYLVPRDGKACLDISYIGLVKIATDTGSVAMVKAEVVFSNDEFQYEGPFNDPVHRFDPFANAEDRGEVIGAYTIAKLTNGQVMIETLRRQEIDKIRSKSKAKSGPWFEFFEEMVKKSVIKRASKMWPRTERIAMAEQVLNEHEGLEYTEVGGEARVYPAMPVEKDITPPKDEPNVADMPPANTEQKHADPKPSTSPTVSPGQAANIRNKAKTQGKDEAALCKEFGVDGDSFDACDQNQWKAIKANLSRG